jgi:polyphosphate kinase 2 (PPK2 family)
VSDEEQERRFQQRIQDPTRRWKISPMDLQSRSRWVEYSKAKDAMFLYTDIEEAHWWVFAPQLGFAPTATGSG